MIYSLVKKYFGLRVTALLMVMLCVLPAQAEVMKVSGVVVDADSRAKLDGVRLELLKDDKPEKSITVSSSGFFIIEYDFDETSNYQLVFNRADYYNSIIDLSSAFASGKMPKKMTIAMSGEESSFFFWGTSLGRDTGKPISDALVMKTNKMTGEQSQIRSNIDGRYSLTVVAGYEYEVVVQTPVHLKRFSRINYCNETLDAGNKFCFFGFNDVTLNEKGSVSGASVLMDEIVIGKKFQVKNIYYDSNKATIPKKVLPNLRKLFYILQDNPQVSIELGSHADSRGSDEYNLALSQRRADTAVNYIVEQGIARKRIRSKGYGETKLVNHCRNGVECTDEQHEENRRTEFVITNIDNSYLEK